MGPPRIRGSRARQQGFTLVELTIAITVLVVAGSALTSSMLASSSLSRANRELALATDGARNRMELILSADPEEVWAIFNSSSADDPSGTTIWGPTFDVVGLTARDADADGLVGEVLFPTTSGQLREDVTDENLGMPRDLNLDGTIDSADHAGDYVILPVRVRVDWTGETGSQRLELFNTVLVVP